MRFLLIPLFLLWSVSFPLHSQQYPPSESPAAKGYVINFTNVSIIEYIRFISRISNTNFVFEEGDLQFKVTIVSEEPTSVSDIMAALIQILNIHGLTLTEQGNNLLIYKGPNISQLATVISGDGESSAPLVTRVLRLVYISPDKAKGLISPLVSPQAVVEVSTETRHLIITDLNANVDKVMQLLKTIDVPNIAIDISVFYPQNSAADALIEIAERILKPVSAAEGSPITLVAQETTNTIFIVGSSDMLNRANNVLEALDQPGTGLEAAHPPPKTQVAIYTAINLPASALISLAQKILTPLAASEGIPFQLTLQPSSQVIYLSSTAAFNARALDVLRTLDQKGGENTLADLPAGDMQNSNFLLYKLEYQNGEKILDALHSIGASLSSGGAVNADLVAALNGVTWLQGTNSLLFAGSPQTMEKIKTMMKQVDQPSRQVFIEMLVIRTSLSNSLTFGVQLGANINSLQGFNLSTGEFTSVSGFSNSFQTPPTVGTTTSPQIPLIPGFNYGSVGNFITHNGQWFGSLGALVNALQTDTDTKIILNPKIIAEDNHEAKVFVGSNNPYTTTNVTIQAANSSTGFTIDYRDVGVLVQVTPTLGLSDMVTLDLHQEITQIDPLQTLTIQGFPVPTTIKTVTDTRVHVPSGYFLALSGMIQNQKVYQSSGLPCIGCIPVIGAAFLNQQQVYQKTNIIVFLQPKIVDTPAEIGWLTNQQGRDFNLNSQPYPCNPDCLNKNDFYKDYNGRPPPCYKQRCPQH